MSVITTFSNEWNIETNDYLNFKDGQIKEKNKSFL